MAGVRSPQTQHCATWTGPGPTPSPQTWAPAYSPGRGWLIIPGTSRFTGEWQGATGMTGTPFLRPVPPPSPSLYLQIH